MSRPPHPPRADLAASPAQPVTEEAVDLPIPALVHTGWRERWPRLVHGLTRPGPGREWDFRLFGGPGEGAVERWQELGPTLGCPSVVHARQPHGRAVRVHGPQPPGFHLCEPADGHATRQPGVVLAVTVADCVPAFLVAAGVGASAMVHAGWRGVAAGILERAVATLGDRFGIPPGELALHLGPAICGDCYEVGPEVHAGLGEPVPPGPAPVDLRGNLARRAAAAGIRPSEITASTLCTRCGPVDLFSHRGGDGSRQVAYLGWG